MRQKIYRNKVWLAVGFLAIFIFSSADAFAWGGGKGGRGHHGGEIVIVGHDRYHYRDGKFFHPGWFGFEFVIATPPFGAVITVLPSGHRALESRGVTYYYYDHVYYRPCPSGYVVVPAPVLEPELVAAPVVMTAIASTQVASSESVTIGIPDVNGSYTNITLIKYNNGYIGPQGEYYSGHPTVEQLKVLYGK